ncbi:MAG: multicopper oxidase family protein [Gemmatimonadota bacterium]|nr:multicopper oxidase family protein [Gemmatimonadota bacterium]
MNSLNSLRRPRLRSRFLAPALFAPLASLAPHVLAAQEHIHQKPLVAAASSSVSVSGPPILVNASRKPGTVEVTITAEPTRVSFVRGASTPAYAYNGRVPGPTLELREGDKVVIHFRNRLPEPSTIHWHGLHLPVVADGSQYHLVPPGGQYDYEFTIQPGTAGTYWYHPHPHNTGHQIAMGLYGAVIIRPPRDPVPAAVTEKVLIFADNRFTSDGSVDFPDPASIPGRIDFENGREGPILFVNGRVMPAMNIRSGEVQRWRVVNASAARVLRLALRGHTFLHIGNDGGLFEHPLEVNEILVANSERVELLVRGTGKPGETAVLQTLPYDRYIPQTRPEDWSTPRDILTVQYTNQPALQPVKLPATYRAIPALDTAKSTATRVMAMSQGMINGKLHDMNRIDVSAPLGAVEIWQIENLVGMDHPFHLHGFQFQVIDRNGVPAPFRSWKDTVNVPKHETVRFIVRYDKYPGKWMFHCHILDHSDHGMMGVLEVK